MIDRDSGEELKGRCCDKVVVTDATNGRVGVETW